MTTLLQARKESQIQFMKPDSTKYREVGVDNRELSVANVCKKMITGLERIASSDVEEPRKESKRRWKRRRVMDTDKGFKQWGKGVPGFGVSPQR